jgi:nucleolar protein 9
MFDQTYHKGDQFDVAALLKLEEGKSNTNGDAPKTNGHATTGEDVFFSRPSGPSKVHFNILAQSMLVVPGSLSALILDSIITLETATLISMASDHIVTRTLQQAFTTKNASMIQRRKLIQRFYGNFGEMAMDKSASHVVDCIWEGTHGLAFIRERIAEELAENEAMLRDSPCGRAVWKNWKMDMYKRKRPDWVRQSRLKASNDGFQAFSEIDAKETKTPLQAARERHAQAKAKREKEESARGRTMARNAEVKSKATGANRTRPTVTATTT